ncbi:cysteine--tRNA ligase [Aliikangiella maris]|uniref:Cysteine--tRNA ligase n=2 Tax=Aliikangiella maris TaxID=3162458 RepID=A0ABV2BPX0_9GAMM
MVKIFDDLKLLNIQAPTTICRATEHIQEQIDYIRVLEQKGFTYRTADGIYFDTARLDDYGYLARLNIDGLKAGVRVEMKDKRNITDFALWKFTLDTPRQMNWESPWGLGFPGWHIECSAMAKKYLGDRFDIHLGGEDHIAVHHANEIAQSQACVSTNMANFWMHGYFLQIDNQRVAKSGRSLLLSELIERGFEPLAYRYLTLTAHYRSRLNFTWESLLAASKALNRLRAFFSETLVPGEVDKMFQREFLLRVNDDLNTPQALALIWQMVQSEMPKSTIQANLNYAEQLLGLSLSVSSNINANENSMTIDSNQSSSNESNIPAVLIQLAKERNTARLSGDWSLADNLRVKIEAQGYTIEDLADGYRLRRKRC